MPEGFVSVATIVHITDLHLAVSGDGVARPPERLVVASRFLKGALQRSSVTARWADGLTTHNPQASRALFRALAALVDAQDDRAGPLVIAQTGDVEAFGRDLTATDPADEFGGYHHLQHTVWPRLGGAHVVEVHGNHDIWSGGWPLTTPRVDLEGNASALTRFDRLAGPVPGAPVPPISCPEGISVELYTLNTIATRFRDAVTAAGRPALHPPPDEDVEDVLARLRAAVGDADGDDRRRLRVLLCHHPLHDFPPGGRFHRMTTGRVADAKLVAQTVDELGFDLVLVGHRHRVDPPFGVTEVEHQPYLGDRVLQLSTGSATQSPGYGGLDEHSYTFSKYDLLLAREQRLHRLIVLRTVFAYSDGDRQFLPTEHGQQPVFRRLAL